MTKPIDGDEAIKRKRKGKKTDPMPIFEDENNNSTWIEFDPFNPVLPKEGERISMRLKPDTKTRYEFGKKKGHSAVLTAPMVVFGYRYSSNRAYIPIYRMSINFRASVESWKREAGSFYWNGAGRDGEENHLNPEE